MITLNTATNITPAKQPFKKNISFGQNQTPPLGGDKFELTPEYIQEHPVEFVYDPQNPKIKKSIKINIGAYENIKKLSPEFYDEYLEKGIDELMRFAFYIEKDKQGKPTEYPNCILIEDASDTIGKDLIKMTRDMSDVNYDFVEYKGLQETQKDLHLALKKGKENFEKTGKLTLLEVDQMSKLVSKDAPFSLTEWMKDITTSCADEFKTVIIFKTRDCKNIVSEVLEPHRAGLKVFTRMAPLPEAVVKTERIKPALKEAAEEIRQELPQKAEETIVETPKKSVLINENTEKKIEQTVKRTEEEIKTTVKENAKKLEKSPNKIIKKLLLFIGLGGGALGGYTYLKNKSGNKENENNVKQ